MGEFSKNDRGLTEQTLANARAGDDAAFADIAAVMMPVLRHLAAEYQAAGMTDADDLVQEGLLGLLSAVHTYRAQTGASFQTYASVCIRNRMRSAMRRINGGKSVRAVDTVPLEPDLASSQLTVEAYQDLREECETLLRRVETKLSPTERTVLYLFLSGLSYSEISEKLEKTPKSVDNALQRVRRKLQTRDD